MELKIFRDTLPQGGAGCTVKAELPLETEIRISDDLPPVGKMVKCFVHPVVLQRQLQPGRLTLEGYLRCTVFYQSEAEKDLCQTEQKLPFTRQLELPELAFTAWTAVVEGQTEYLNTRAADPRRIEVRGAYGLVVTVHTQCKTEVITALADGGIEQQLRTLQGVRSVAVLDKLVTLEGELVFAKPPAAVLDITGNACVGVAGAVRVAGRRGYCPAKSGGGTALPAGDRSRGHHRGLPLLMCGRAGGVYPVAGRKRRCPADGKRHAAPAGMAQLSAAGGGGCFFHPV